MRWTLAAFASACFWCVAGCGNDQGFQEIPKGTKVVDAPHEHEHEHGPHGGHIVELGEEEYHGEVRFEPKDAKIVVYLLDSSMKSPVPIEDKTVSLELTIDGKPKTVALAPSPQSDDPKGQSSRFELAGDADVKQGIKDEEDLKGTLKVTIKGKAFTGKISHDHAH